MGLLSQSGPGYTLENYMYVHGLLLYLCLLQVRAFLGHHLSQQLVLQSITSDGEVDESGLGLHLGLVVRVGQLGLEYHTEPIKKF